MYISEAHPDDEWQMDSNRKESFVFKQPQSMDQRLKLARILPEDGRAEKAFAAWPERIYILDVGGKVAYKAEPGPFGFKPKEAEAALERLVAGG